MDSGKLFFLKNGVKKKNYLISVINSSAYSINECLLVLYKITDNITIAIKIRLQLPATNPVELIRQRCKSKIKAMPEPTNRDVMDDYFEDFM